MFLRSHRFRDTNYRVATLTGNLEKPGIWEILKKKLEFLTIFTCLAVKFLIDLKKLSCK